MRLASDLAARIRETRQALKESQDAFATRWGRTAKQVSSWERGKQAPHSSAVRRVAQKENWPLEMFQEGGPRPRDVLTERRRFEAVPTRVLKEPAVGGYGSGQTALESMRTECLQLIHEKEIAGQPFLYSEVSGMIERMYSAAQQTMAVAPEGVTAAPKAGPSPGLLESADEALDPPPVPPHKGKPGKPGTGRRRQA